MWHPSSVEWRWIKLEIPNKCARGPVGVVEVITGIEMKPQLPEQISSKIDDKKLNGIS